MGILYRTIADYTNIDYAIVSTEFMCSLYYAVVYRVHVETLRVSSKYSSSTSRVRVTLPLVEYYCSRVTLLEYVNSVELMLISAKALLS